MFRRLLYCTITGVFLASLAMVAQANTVQPVINVDQGPDLKPTGTISYDGNGGPLSGNDITFDTISGQRTPEGSGPGESLHCVNTCDLNFTTGDNTSEGPNRWTFGDGGNITLTGKVQNADGDTIASGTLMQGTFSDVPAVDGSANNNRLTFASFGPNNVASGLVDYFGLDSDASFRFTHTDIVASGASFGDDGSFNGGVDNGDLTTTQKVPEPGAFGIFGLALIMVAGLIAVRRRTTNV